jgi:hypothetical protein
MGWVGIMALGVLIFAFPQFSFHTCLHSRL